MCHGLINGDHRCLKGSLRNRLVWGTHTKTQYLVGQCTADNCSVLQTTAVYCKQLQCTANNCSVLQTTAVYCRQLQCTADNCSSHLKL